MSIEETSMSLEPEHEPIAATSAPSGSANNQHIDVVSNDGTGDNSDSLSETSNESSIFEEQDEEHAGNTYTPSANESARLIVDYLISEGYREAAELLCQEAGLKLPKQDIANLDARVAIRNLIISGDIPSAIQKVEQLCPKLLLENNEVRFNLFQQNLIELVRKSQMVEALAFAQEHISSDNTLNDDQLERLEQTFALLAFEKPEDSPFAKLLDESHRQMVSTAVNSAVLTALNRPAAPRLEALLRMIVWSQRQLSGRVGHACKTDPNLILRDIFNKTFL